MTDAADPQSNESRPLRRRFRFGLKVLFIVMTLLCVWLGWRLARQRQAAEIVALSHVVMDAIESNMSTAPPNTTFATPLSLRQRTNSFLKSTRPKAAEQTNQLSGVFSNGRFYNMTIRGESLDITELLATTNGGNASVRIRSHYEQGLAKIGLRRILTSDGEKATSIWQMPDHGLHLVIDVDANATNKQADVRVIYLHNDSLSIW